MSPGKLDGRSPLKVRHEPENTLRRQLIWAGSLGLLLGATGCFERITKVGPPERIGSFSIQKLHIVSFHDTGNSERDYFEIAHGRFFRTTIGMPPNDWSQFDRVTRLPSKSLTLLVESGSWSALVTERDGQPRVETLWEGDDNNPIQGISATRWHIPDYQPIAQPPQYTFSGGHIFDGTTLAKHSLPNQPGEGRHQFAGTSPDDEAVAWVTRGFDSSVGAATCTIMVADELGMTGPTLTTNAEFLKRHPPPDQFMPLPLAAWTTWLEGNFNWKLNGSHRWILEFKQR